MNSFTMTNVILRTDSYKFSHSKQYPPGTAYVRSYMEARGGSYAHTLTFGALRLFLEELFGLPILARDINEAEDYVTKHMGPGIFNRAGWEHILNEHGGMMPLRIRAVPEGLFVPIGNALITVENTDPAVPWLTNYFETAFYPWYPYTVATLSNDCRRRLSQALELTGDPGLIDFKLHDFGFRGTTDPCVGWQAAIGGLAHLVNFKGTDTVAALIAAREYYGEDMAGFSIPAAEHSTITSWGREHEVDAFQNMLRSYPTGLVAVVSDSFNIYDACDKLWGETLHADVLARDGVLVVRPDSGDPATVMAECLHKLYHRFGGTINTKGYRVLNPKVRLIWGDGIDPIGMQEVCDVAANHGFSTDNFAFGMGGGLLQRVNRDTQKFAFKCSQVEFADGRLLDVSKDPVTDSGKKSKAGNLTLMTTLDGRYATMKRRMKDGRDTSLHTADWGDCMRTVYENGVIQNCDTLATIRARARGLEAHAWKHHEVTTV
jgi:nicotinamide phosphoribosyltransferase